MRSFPFRLVSVACDSRVWAVAILIGVCAIGWSVGYRSRSRMQDSVWGQAGTSQVKYTANVGRIIAGGSIRHTFTAINQGSNTLEIANDSDIKLSCGCASLVPMDRVLEPGQSTEIRLTVHTSEKPGPFRHRGSIYWSLPNGARSIMEFSLSGDAVAPLIATPASLEFGEREIQERVPLQFTLSENLPIDWDSLQVSSESNDFLIERLKVRRSNAIVSVACNSSELQQLTNGYVLVKARALPSPLLAKDATVQMYVPLRARATTILTVSPETVPLAFVDGVASARVLLQATGDTGPVAALIRDITCAGCKVTWEQAGKQTSSVAVLDITLTCSQQNTASEWREPIVFHLKDQKQIAVPSVRLVSPQ